MKLYMHPREKDFAKNDWNGIRMVVRYYEQYLTSNHDVEFVDESDQANLVVLHAGSRPDNIDYKMLDVAHCHGLYWTEDFNSPVWEYKENAYVIRNLRHALSISAPSQWVATNITRDSRRPVTVLPHGIEWNDWQRNDDSMGYVLWNKNRTSDACDPTPAYELALARPDILMLSTFMPDGIDPPSNIRTTGKIPHSEMVKAIMGCGVYLATTKETFGIGILEAMAAGKPVLAYDEGGAADLVVHGETGYLAVPGSIEDLTAGLEFCYDNSVALGNNGRELARSYEWNNVIGNVYKFYEDTIKKKKQPNDVSVIIPVYNYGNELPRAVRSVVEQTTQAKEIVIVDDGSTDHSLDVANQLADEYPNVSVISQPNGGVAAARNAGIMSVDTKFIVCLDADDAIEPDFIKTCLEPMVGDNGLGITYTKLRDVLPNGAEKVSQWPHEFSYSDQLSGYNQVPTCCMFRRDMWEQTGGYKTRCSLSGAGFEDADLWLRAGAYGWRAEMVTHEPLFIYSLGSGRVSSMNRQDMRRFEKAHHDDIKTWYPFATDHMQPFMSLIEPQSYSHPVRQYDMADVGVVIPVGPGHERLVEGALDSLDAQTYRFWETVVVWDTNYDTPQARRIKTAYPHVKHITSVIDGEPQGAGVARNMGVDEISAPMLTFLDADDWLFPTFLEETMDAYYTHQSAIYTDYMGKACVDDINQLADNLSRNVQHHANGIAVIKYEAADYDCERAQRQPEDPPWIWNNINTVFPREWHYEIGGFDESMPSWEDIDYWYRMARQGKCFVRLPRPLMMYRFYTGHRRDSVHQSGQRWQHLLQYIKWKMEEIESMGCSGCRQKSAPRAVSRVSSSPTPQPSQRVAVSQYDNDVDWVTCRYNSANSGDQPVILVGQDGGKRKVMLAPGDKLLVHISDVNAIPGRFTPIAERKLPARQPRPKPVEVHGRPTQDRNNSYARFLDEKVEEAVSEQAVAQDVTQGAVDDQVVGPDNITIDEFLKKRGEERDKAYEEFRKNNPLHDDGDGDDGNDSREEFASAPKTSSVEEQEESTTGPKKTTRRKVTRRKKSS